ncbi:MAG: hypothetical protein K2Y22_11770 [Candidatus Obscuribacterales bacterium]|nr:hypothetical protein [Candidatus Obscuribacterales bacterium]
MSSHKETESSKETLLQELTSLPGDFVQAAVSAAYWNPVRGVTQLKDRIYHPIRPGSLEDVQSEHRPSAFGSLRWHAEQLGGAVGTMLPYCILNKAVGLVGVAKILTPFATGALMEGVFRPIERTEGDFNKARIVNALTGMATFGTLGHLPGYLKSRDVMRFQIDQPWLINSFTSDLKRHLVSGVAAGVVDTESRSLFSGKGLNTNAEEIIQSVYSYGALGGLMCSASEVGPYLSKGRTINDIVQTSPYLSERAKLDPVAKELIVEYGEQRVRAKNRSAARDIYDLFAHANVAEAMELKNNSMNGTISFTEKQSHPVEELLRTNLPIEKFPFYSYHPTSAYAEAFKNSSKEATGFLGVGFDSVVIKLKDGGALKISSQLRDAEMGQRIFDMPILEEGLFDTKKIADAILENPQASEWQKIQLRLLHEPKRGVNYIVQPEAMTKIPIKLIQRFREHMPKIGYEFWDWQHDQLGYYDGRIVLLDYFAVKSAEVLKAERDKKAREDNQRPIATRLEEIVEKL